MGGWRVDEQLMQSVAEQLMTAGVVIIPGQSVETRKTSRNRLRTARFTMDGRQYEAIEQNADKPSPWGKLARAGHRVVQFRDIETGKYVAVSVDGKVQVYGRLPSGRE